MVRSPAPYPETPPPPTFLEWFDEFLSEEDVHTLTQGLETFWRAYRRLPAESFPRLVIYTDTSARPLAALFRPVLEALAERAGRSGPQARFLATHPNDLMVDALWNGFADEERLSDWYVEARGRQIDAVIAKERRRRQRLAMQPGTATERGIEKVEAGIQRLEEERGQLVETAEAWQRHWASLVDRFMAVAMQASGAPEERIPILCVDERVYLAHTVKLVCMAVHEANRRLTREPDAPLLELRLFTFGDARVDRDHHERDYPGVPYRDFRQVLGDRYLVGVRGSIAGDFRYASRDDVAGHPEQEDPFWKQRSIGVIKSLVDPYARRSPHAHLERMQALRRLLGAIGSQQVARLQAENP